MNQEMRERIERTLKQIACEKDPINPHRAIWEEGTPFPVEDSEAGDKLARKGFLTRYGARFRATAQGEMALRNLQAHK